jgi:Domain of unknown function (DUF1330)
MPKGYWIGRVDVSDPEGYKAYVAANAEPFRKYGAKFVVRGGTFEAKEGRAGRATSCWSSRAMRPRSPATSRPNINAPSRCARPIRTPTSS